MNCEGVSPARSAFSRSAPYTSGESGTRAITELGSCEKYGLSFSRRSASNLQIRESFSCDLSEEAFATRGQ